MEFFGVLPYYDAGDGNPRHYIPRQYARSNIFSAGGYYWCAWVYKTDLIRNWAAINDDFSVTLKLVSTGVRVTAVHEVSVLDPNANLPPMLLSTWPASCFASDSDADDDNGQYCALGGLDLDQFAGYVHDGRILFQSTVTVLDDPKIDLPPSDMLGQLGDIHKTMEGADSPSPWTASSSRRTRSYSPHGRRCSRRSSTGE